MPLRDLCDAAITVFAAKGYHAATLKEIAATAAVDPSLISYQFGSKLGLWKAVIADLGERLQTLFADLEPPGAGSDPRETVRRTLTEIVHFMCDNPQFPHFMARDIYREDERTDWVNEKLVFPLLKHLRGHMESLRAAGELQPGPPDMMILHFGYGMTFNIIRREKLYRSAPELADDARFRETLTEMLIGSIFRDG